MNPDLETDIQSGRPVVTIYVTSGDGGDPNSAWRARETSGMAAHAAMAGVASNWLCGGATYAGKTTTRCTLPGRDGLVMVMLRVGDGSVPNTTSTGTVATIDKAATYTRAELMATLAAIQTQVAPVKVGTLDGTLAYGSDHQDHIAVGVLMFDVARADGVARALTMYRGYSMFEPMFATGMLPAAEPVNLTTAQYQEKLRIISVYETAAPGRSVRRMVPPHVSDAHGDGRLRAPAYQRWKLSAGVGYRGWRVGDRGDLQWRRVPELDRGHQQPCGRLRWSLPGGGHGRYRRRTAHLQQRLRRSALDIAEQRPAQGNGPHLPHLLRQQRLGHGVRLGHLATTIFATGLPALGPLTFLLHDQIGGVQHRGAIYGVGIVAAISRRGDGSVAGRVDPVHRCARPGMEEATGRPGARRWCCHPIRSGQMQQS